MKIRNGFVSNSSSSSFILTYNKNRVLTDPKEIVEYIKNNPDSPIVFNGGECNEGDDIFELDEELKSLVRKFPMEFIKTNTGTQTYTDYQYEPDDLTDHVHVVEKQIPKVTAYVDGVKLVPCESEYKDFKVDMSDVDYEEVSLEDWPKKNTDPEIKRKFEINDNWCRIKEERENKARKDYEEKLKSDYKSEVAREQNISESEVSSELVYVSNSSCNPDYSYPGDFAERYLTTEVFDDYDQPGFYHINKRDRSKACPFSVFYEEAITDKNEIVDYISNCLNTSGGKTYLVWNNPVYNSIYENEEKLFDFYEIGEKEAEVFKDNKDNFLKNDRESTLFTNSEVMIESGEISGNHGNKLSMDYGKVIVIPSENDLKDFKKNVSEGER